MSARLGRARLVACAIVIAACGSEPSPLVAEAPGSAVAPGGDLDRGGSTGSGTGDAKPPPGSPPPNPTAPTSPTTPPTTPPPQNGPLVLRKLSGDGSAVIAAWPNIDPLVVEVTQNGKPVSGLIVTFAPQGDVGVYPATAATDARGRAESAPRGTPMSQSAQSWSVGSVTASVPSGQSVVFTVTTTNPGPSIPVQPSIMLVDPVDRDLGSGSVGTVKPKAVKVRIAAAAGFMTGQPIPNVGMRLIDYDDMSGESVASCVGGTVMTNAQGEATCDVRFDRAAPKTLGVLVGGLVKYALFAQITP